MENAQELHYQPRSGLPAPPVRKFPSGIWGAGLGLSAFVLAFFGSMFAAIPAVVFDAAAGKDSTVAKVGGATGSLLLQNIIFVGLPVILLVLVAGARRPSDYQLKLPKPWIALGAVVTAAIIFVLVSAGITWALNAEDVKDPLPKTLGADRSLAAGIVIAIAVVTLAPIGEEFLLRGVVYPGLRNTFESFKLNRWLAVALAAVANGLIFGLLHVGGSAIESLPVLAVFGLLLCLLVQVTGSLFPSIFLHMTNNSVAIATSLKWSVQGWFALWLLAIAVLAVIVLIARALEKRSERKGSAPGSAAPPAFGLS